MECVRKFQTLTDFILLGTADEVKYGRVGGMDEDVDECSLM